MKKDTCPWCGQEIIKPENSEMQQIAQAYVLKIHPLRSKDGVVHINTQAKDKITSRLKEFTLEQLLTAIDKFSKNTWQMANNSHRGLAWFFHSEDRVEKFLVLPEDRVVKEVRGEKTWKVGNKYYTLEEIKLAEKYGAIEYNEKEEKYVPTSK